MDEWDDDETCPRCGGEGVVLLSDEPASWGEDTFCEEDKLIECPECHGKGVL